MTIDFTQLAQDIKAWGKTLGFQQIAIAGVELGPAHQQLLEWLENKRHGSMQYMERNTDLRADPAKLWPGTLRIIGARLNYHPLDSQIKDILQDKTRAYISRYALGRDYHKVMRKRLLKLAKKITEKIGEFNYRSFADSAPIMEKPLAANMGLGWMGKNTLILNREGGSWFFLGELLVDLPLPVDSPIDNHCGSCTACLDICPTQAIVAPYQLDARRCISYLTIENKGPIPEEFRTQMGNRIFGCDDCQLICPWNKFAKMTEENDFKPRHGLNNAELIDLFNWTEAEYLAKTEGMALRRVGYIGWLRNIAVALGNAPSSLETIAALQSRLNFPNELVQEHVEWALRSSQGAIESGG